MADAATHEPEKLADKTDTALLSAESSTIEVQTASDSQAQAEISRELATEENPATPAPDASVEVEPAHAAQPSPSRGSRSSSRTADRSRPSNAPDRLESEKPLPSTSGMRPEAHLPSRPPRQADTRLPIRPDHPDNRRDRHRDLPRGGRYNDREHARSEQPVYEIRNYGRLDREIPARTVADEQFRNAPYLDGRVPREPSRLERSGRMRSSESFHGRPEPDRGVREGPAGPRTGPLDAAESWRSI